MDITPYLDVLLDDATYSPFRHHLRLIKKDSRGEQVLKVEVVYTRADISRVTGPYFVNNTETGYTKIFFTKEQVDIYQKPNNKSLGQTESPTKFLGRRSSDGKKFEGTYDIPGTTEKGTFTLDLCDGAAEQAICDNLSPNCSLARCKLEKIVQNPQ